VVVAAIVCQWVVVIRETTQTNTATNRLSTTREMSLLLMISVA